MITIQKCREILGPKHELFTDVQVEGVRDQLYALADVVIIGLFKKFYLTIFKPADFVVVTDKVFVNIVDA